MQSLYKLVHKTKKQKGRGPKEEIVNQPSLEEIQKMLNYI